MNGRCPLCPGVNACIPPDGPDDADILFIGEAPGNEENRRALKHPPGVPFIGKTGEEVNRHYLPLAGLRREKVRFANAIRCLPTSAGGKLDLNRAKDQALLDSCAAYHLYPDIERYRPRLIVPLGAFACRAVCPEVDLELQHGMPIDTAWNIPAFPQYHPALGIHEPKKMLYIRTDWQRLRSFLAGTLVLCEDGYEGLEDYREVTDAEEIDALDPTQPLACDTESTKNREPFCLTYSNQMGTGRLIRAARIDLLEALQSKLDSWNSLVLFHNWLYDWSVTDLLGLRFPLERVRDTMAAVYHLGNLPQGLKALAFRELGMGMQDFDDLVTPYSASNVLHYYEIARTCDWQKPDEQLVIDDKTGLWKLYKPQSMSTKLKRFFTDYGKNPAKDVFDMWEKNWIAEQPIIEEQCGPWPGKCITHVPFEKVLHYACRDADATLRLWPILRGMRRVMRKYSQEHWRSYVST